MKDFRYIRNKDKFLEYTYCALKDHFSSINELDNYYNAIKNDSYKNLFLKTASFYLFLVKRGFWALDDIPDSNREINYLTISYKFIAIVSLIESLFANKFMDFKDFLIRKRSKVTFPISNKAELIMYYDQYKEKFGSNRKFVTFCQALSLERQRDLVARYINRLPVLRIKPVPPPDEEIPKYLERLAKDLYDLRSKFVHEAKLVLDMLPGTTVSLRDNKLVVCNLSIQDVMEFFEEGLLIHFNKGHKDQKN